MNLRGAEIHGTTQTTPSKPDIPAIMHDDGSHSLSRLIIKILTSLPVLVSTQKGSWN